MEDYICPNCKNPIYDENALLCHFCGGSLKRAGSGFLSGIKYQNKQVWLYFIVFVVLVAFAWLILF